MTKIKSKAMLEERRGQIGLQELTNPMEQKDLRERFGEQAPLTLPPPSGQHR